MTLARFLSPDDFGTIAVLTVFITISNILVDSGLSSSLILEKEITKEDISTLFTFNTIVSIFLYLLIYICSPLIESYFQINNLATVCRLLCLPIITNALIIVPKTLLVRNLRFDSIFWVQLLSMVFSCIITLYCVIVHSWKISALILYYNLVALLPVFGYWLYNKELPQLGFKIEAFKKLFSFGAFNTLSSFVETFYENILSILIGKYLNVTEAGYYTQAKKLEEVPSRSITELIGGVAFPILCKNNTNEQWFVDKCKIIQSVLYSTMFPIMIILMIFAHQIIQLCFGYQWANASEFLTLLSFAGIWIIVENTIRSFIKSLGRADLMFKWALIKRSIGIALIIVALLISTEYLLYGYILSAMIGCFINIYVLSTIIPYSILQQFLLLIKIFISCVILLVLCSITNLLFYDNLLLCIVGVGISLVVYLISLNMFGVKEIKYVFCQILYRK